MPAIGSNFNSALSELDNSVSVPSYTPMPLRGFQAPTPIPISGNNWNLTPQDFNINAAPSMDPQTATSGGSSSPISNWLDSFKTGWNSVEDNPITRNILQPIGNTFAGVSSMFSSMSPDNSQPLSWSDLNPFNPIVKGIEGFQQGYSNPDQTPLGKEDAAWRSLLANSLDPRGKLQSPFQSIQEGWNNPSNQPSYRSIADDMLLGGNDVRGLSGILGLAGGFTNPVNLVGMKAPFSAAEDASTIARDLPGHYTPPETVGSMPKLPFDQQPFNVLSQPPKFDMNFDSVPKSNFSNDLPTSNMSDINNLADSILGKEQAAPSLETPSKLNIGDLVTPTNERGDLLTSEPVKINDVQEMNGQKFYQVEGSKTYFPESQILSNQEPIIKTMNANTATNMPQDIASEAPNIAESLPKQTNPNYKPGGLFGWWENKLGNPVMNAAGNVASKIADAPVINKLTDTLGKGFVKNYGASSDLVNILKNREAEHAANQSNIVDSVGNLAKNTLTNEELNSLGHVIEKTQEGTDNQNSFLPRYQAIKENGVSDSTGTNALLNTTLDGKPLLSEDQLLENHFSHMYRNVPKELQGVFPKQGNKTGGLSPKGEFAMPRTFGTLKEAEEAGLKPVTDPLQVLGEYLYQTSKAVTNAKALEDIKSTPGLLFDKATVDNVSKLVKTGRMSADEAARELGMSLDELKRGFVQSSIPQLNKFYIRPADEAAIRSYLDHVDKSTLYDKAMGLWKKGTVFNSLVHMHNILYNGMFLGKAKIGYTFETLKNLASKQPDEWYQRALRSGAISADRGSFLENLKKSIQNVGNPIREKLAYAFHGVLWDMDKSMRTAIFREVAEQFMTNGKKFEDLSPSVIQQAAARANKFLIDYNNLTPFEEKVMTRIFPFYRWMKGNIPLQAEQWITNMPKQALAQIVNMQLAQAMTGQSPNEEGKWDISNLTGGPLSNGDHVMMDPYFPGEEIGKIASKGVLPYLYGVSNPILKEAASQVMNRAYYPNENFAPNGKEKMGSDKYTIRNEFASPLENAASTIGHAASNFLPAINVKGIPIGQLANIGGDSLNNGGSRSIVNDLMGIQQKDKPATTLPEYLIKGLGGFASRDNPVMDEYYQKTDARDAQQRKNAYNKSHGIPVTPQDRKAAYKKIPFPMGQ